MLIKKLNLPHHYRSDFYHRIFKISWRHFFLLYACFFLGINLLFALIYFLLPVGAFNITQDAHLSLKFMDAFAFAVQTFSTIGYGAIYPTSAASHSFVTIQSMLSLLSTGAMAGLFFSKLSTPSARILFSKPILITNFFQKKSLIFRVANARENQIISAKVEVNFTKMITTPEGSPMRRFYSLPLERNSSPLFALTWTIIHPITPDSPFFEKSLEDLQKEKVEIYVIIHGIDGTFNQTIHQTYQYLPKDFIEDAQFQDVITIQKDGTRIIDYQKFHLLK